MNQKIDSIKGKVERLKSSLYERAKELLSQFETVTFNKHQNKTLFYIVQNYFAQKDHLWLESHIRENGYFPLIISNGKYDFKADFKIDEDNSISIEMDCNSKGRIHSIEHEIGFDWAFT